MNTIYPSGQRWDINELSSFRGQSNAELLEHESVRTIFQRFAAKYQQVETADLLQQAYTQFLRTKPIVTDKIFGPYLLLAIKSAVRMAYRWMHQKKRHLKAYQLDCDRDTGATLEPKGESAAILFSSDELESVRSKLRCCLLYTSPSPRDQRGSRMPSSA